MSVHRARPRHYIKQWRNFKRISQRKLAARMIGPDGEQVISYASISRIERGEQEYTQPVLEALADALGTDPASLIMRNPASPDPIWSIWDRIPASERTRALHILEAFARKAS